jgi:hypothetical protein
MSLWTVFETAMFPRIQSFSVEDDSEGSEGFRIGWYVIEEKQE